MRRFRSSTSDECSLTARSSGQKRLISVIHDESTESGATTRCGPGTPRSNLRCARKAMVCSTEGRILGAYGRGQDHLTASCPARIIYRRLYAMVRMVADLQRLAQPHLVSEDGVAAVGVHGGQPVSQQAWRGVAGGWEGRARRGAHWLQARCSPSTAGWLVGGRPAIAGCSPGLRGHAVALMTCRAPAQPSHLVVAHLDLDLAGLLQRLVLLPSGGARGQLTPTTSRAPPPGRAPRQGVAWRGAWGMGRGVRRVVGRGVGRGTTCAIPGPPDLAGGSLAPKRVSTARCGSRKARRRTVASSRAVFISAFFESRSCGKRQR